MLTITYSYLGGPTQTISLDGATTSAGQQTAAIQSALDAVAGHAGANVTLSAGTFTVIGNGTASNGALRVGSETTLEGAGMGQTVLKLADGAGAVTGIIRTDSGETNADGSFQTTQNVTIKDITIDGNKAATTGEVDGFYAGGRPNSGQYDSNIVLDRVEVMNASRYGFDPHEQVVGLTITNSVAHDNGVDGFTIDFSSNVLLSDNQSYANGRHGFNIVTSSSNVALRRQRCLGQRRLRRRGADRRQRDPRVYARHPDHRRQRSRTTAAPASNCARRPTSSSITSRSAATSSRRCGCTASRT